MMRTCGVSCLQELLDRGADESSTVVEFAFRTRRVVYEARFVAGLLRTGPVGLTHSQESEKDILGLLTLLEPPCFATDFQRAVVCRLQRSAETCFWTWVSVPQNGET